MSFISFEPSGAWSSLGAAVLHFLWQGALVGCVTAGILIFIRRTSSSARYAAALGGLLVGFLIFSGTFLHYLFESSTAALPSAGVFSPSSMGGGILMAPAPSLDWTPIAAWCWLAGTLMMSIRLMWNCLGVRRLKTKQTSVPEDHWIDSFQGLRLELGIKRAVRLVASGIAEVPMVVGWLSPIVIVPVAAFASLDPAQLRCLLAHELQHIRRHDHLINAIQVVLETILFFHPVIWWLSKQVRLEREYCCDQTALQLTGDPKLLAQALTSMEALRIQQPNPDFVLAANGGPLMQRIARILSLRADRRRSFSGWQLPVGLIVAGVLATAGQTLAQPGIAQDERPAAQKSDQEAASQRKVRSEWLKVDAKLKALVKEGKITPEQAKARLEQYRKKIAEEKAARQKKEPGQAAGKKRVDAYGRKLRQAVTDGEMTSDEARAKMAAARKRMAERPGKAVVQDSDQEAARQRKVRAEWLKVDAKLKALVEEGKITPEQAKARLEQYRRKIAEEKVARQKKGPDQAAGKKRLEVYGRKLRQAVADGEMTSAEARLKMEEARKRMAERQAKAGRDKPGARRDKAAGEYARAERVLKELVKRGEITKEQAIERLAGLKQRMAEHGGQKDAEAQDARRKARAEYAAAEKKMRKLVEQGMATEEQAEQRLQEMRKAFGPRQQFSPREQAAERQRLRDHFAEREARVKELAEAGMLSEVEARERIGKLRRAYKEQLGPNGAHVRGDDLRAREEYAAAEKRFRQLVKKGMATEAEVEMRLAEMRKRLGPPRDSSLAEQRAQLERDRSLLEAEAKRLDGLVAAGRLSEAQRREKLEAAASKLGRAKSDDERRRRELAVRYDAVEKELNGLVKAGLITPDQAKQRLEGLRKSFEKPKTQPKEEQARARYEAAAARMKKAVEAGKMTREQAKLKLEAIKKRLGGEKDSADNKKGKEIRAQYEAAEARVKAAVKAGKLTEEEGRKRLIEFRKRLGRERSADKPKRERR